MTERDEIDIKVDEILEILQENGSESKMRISNEDGTINKEAIVKVESNLKDIKDLNKAKISKEQCRSNVMKTDTVAPYTEGWGIFGKKRKVNVYIPIQISATKALKADLDKVFDKMSVGCKFMHNLIELQNDAPLLVVCPISSRLEPDVDHALQGLEWPTRFVAVVLNMTRENSLPRLPTESRLNTKQERYRNIEFIDAAFTPDERLYNCNMNVEAERKLSAYIEAMYKK